MNYKITNLYHLELLKKLKEQASEITDKRKRQTKKDYLGTTKIYYDIKASVKEKIVKDWIKKHPKLSIAEYTHLLTSLFKGKSHEEILIGGKLLKLLPKFRKQLDPNLIDKWLGNVEGWAEVDSICQSNFSAEELLLNWNNWKKLIIDFSLSENPHKRRTSLVLLTMPVRKSPDPKLSKLAFKIIDKLKKENHPLIAKAISWLLRSLIKNHRREVEKYLKENQDLLPKTALRETKKSF